MGACRTLSRGAHCLSLPNLCELCAFQQKMRANEFEREIWLRADPTSASVAREFAGDAAEEVGCDHAAAEACRLAISEAVANAVEHGAPCDNGLISVSVYLEARCLTTEICDCGNFHAARQAEDLLDQRGRGLPLMLR
jgi:anti-sigma regulatory factor (Ser/Thr protein kinase)